MEALYEMSQPIFQMDVQMTKHEKIPADILQMTGLQQLQAMLDGHLEPPSITATLDFIMTEASEGQATFVGNPSHKHLNPLGSVHGGYAATLLDSALGCAVHTTIAPGEGYTTVDLNIKYVRAVTPDTGPLTCSARIVHRGRSIATADATLTDKDGKLYAHGSTTCMILPSKRPHEG